MGLVKTRRLAYPPLAGVRDPWGSEHAERSECRAMQKQQRAIRLRQGYGGLKAGMKPPAYKDRREGDFRSRHDVDARRAGAAGRLAR